MSHENWSRNAILLVIMASIVVVVVFTLMSSFSKHSEYKAELCEWCEERGYENCYEYGSMFCMKIDGDDYIRKRATRINGTFYWYVVEGAS